MGSVYLLKTEIDDWTIYKIGFTKKSIQKRIKQLQTGSATPIHLVHFYKTQNYSKVEKWLHRKWKQKRQKGEWFDLSLEDVNEFIPECKKADQTIKYLIENNPFWN